MHLRAIKNAIFPPKAAKPGLAAMPERAGEKPDGQPLESFERRLQSFQSEGSLQGRQLSDPGFFQPTLAACQARMKQLEQTDRGEISNLYQRDQNPEPGAVGFSIPDSDSVDAKFRGSSQGDFAFTEIQKSVDTYGVPREQKTSVAYNGTTLTVLTETRDAWGEGLVSAKSLTAQSSYGEILSLG